jgi:fimbrial chaperone protein
MNKALATLLSVVGAGMAFLVPAFSAVAAPFEIAVSPARFELSGKVNSRVGQSFDMYNVGKAATEVSVRTLDWSYSETGGITYIDELLPNSCRPWVTLERKTVKIGANSKAAFRFQVEVPADAVRGECRFMLAIEGVEPAYKSVIEGGGASLSLPVSGRIAVAVYMAVNGGESKLEVTQIGMQDINGKRTPSVTVTNKGDAHGRLDGVLDAVDAKGQAFELTPESTPIMPGQTRTLPLSQKTEPNQKPIDVTYPIKSKGTLDWEKGSFKINVEFK